MVTTKLTEEEKKIRKNLRIKEVRDPVSGALFYPQIKKFGLWEYFRTNYPTTMDIIFLDGPVKIFCTLNEAKKFIDNYVSKKLKKKEIIYHNVNYLTT